MEKNERLAWRKKPRTYCRCFSSCPKRHCKGRPFQLQIRKKTTFQAPKSCFFIFPSRHSWEQALSFSGAFSSCQSAIAKGDPSNCKLEKNNFSGPEKLFFYFPFQTLLGAGTELFRCLFQLPERHCKGRPFQLQIRKKTTFQAPKSCFFYFPFQTLLGAGTKLFRCLFQLPKAAVQRETLPIANEKSNFSGPKKLFFYFPSTHSWEQALRFSGAFSSCPKRHCKGNPSNCKLKKQLFRPRKVVFLFSFQTLLGAGTELFRCLFQLPERHCKGRPFQLQIRKKQLFRPRKVVFYFPFQTLLGTGTKLFRCLFQLPKAPLQRDTLPIAN